MINKPVMNPDLEVANRARKQAADEKTKFVSLSGFQ